MSTDKQSTLVYYYTFTNEHIRKQIININSIFHVNFILLQSLRKRKLLNDLPLLIYNVNIAETLRFNQIPQLETNLRGPLNKIQKY